ncbi:HAMP domain-containing sensor histidine kinase [Xanthobacter sp. DSM 24535]|uniref:histidine kinase n=1 Tax=Aquabacter spiritensis TaxID=933073 RepID=A0A4R3LT83_9HYPH|nr:HAMP domain-containing sensor histidine kinase [Aquabacter spiritensis]TCT01835.1 signal transduction histidine kinase [Aquabacter spiritensis]
MRLDPRTWPIAAKVPLAVAVLMMLVGIVLSERVLARLNETQEMHVRDLAQSYLDILSTGITESVLREDTWEVFDAITRAQDLSKGLRATEAIVTNAKGHVIAASNPRQHPVGSLVEVPNGGSPGMQPFRFEAGADVANATRVLAYPGRVVGVIHAAFDTSHLAVERREVLTALIVTNGILTLILAAAGWLLVTRMMAPIRVLSRHLGAAMEGYATPVPEATIARSGDEFRHLFGSYNALVKSMHEREDLARKLFDEQRLGSLGRLASALAHEINNPLGGLFNAMATLKTHGQYAAVRNNALGLLERGLVGIRDVVRTTLAMHRQETSGRSISAKDIADLRLLIVAEARRKSVTVAIRNSVDQDIPLPSTQIRQALLNLLLNAVAAAPPGSEVKLEAARHGDVLVLVVTDRGDGIPATGIDVLTGEDSSPPLRTGGGLGLWTTRRIVDELHGRIEVSQPSQGGTVIRIAVPIEKPIEELPHVA